MEYVYILLVAIILFSVAKLAFPVNKLYSKVVTEVSNSHIAENPLC